jgi:hypothetical protein
MYDGPQSLIHGQGHGQGHVHGHGHGHGHGVFILASYAFCAAWGAYFPLPKFHQAHATWQSVVTVTAVGVVITVHGHGHGHGPTVTVTVTINPWSQNICLSTERGKKKQSKPISPFHNLRAVAKKKYPVTVTEPRDH